jgi:hypothetical protein
MLVHFEDVFCPAARCRLHLTHNPLRLQANHRLHQFVRRILKKKLCRASVWRHGALREIRCPNGRLIF